MNILVTICARGGSKGIPGKNIKLLNGKSLIAYSIDAALKFANEFPGTQVALSTDSEEIRNVAAECGLVSDYIRPAYLANDTCGKIDAINDILLYTEKKLHMQFDFVLDLDATSPCRNLNDLKEAFSIICADTDAVNLFSVSQPGRNPYFNQVEMKENGYYNLVKMKDGIPLSRQTAPKVYDLNASFYFYKRKFFELGYKGAITDRSLIYEVKHLCFDLDHPVDFDFMSFLMENNRLDFEL